MQQQRCGLGPRRALVLVPATQRRPAARSSSLAAVTCQQQQEQQQPVLRRLIMMRHANSQLAGPTRDHDRPILPEGAQAAQEVAKQLRELGWIPDVVFCSNALRTRQTFEVMREVIPELEDADAHFLGSLYTVAALDGQTREHLAKILAGAAAASQRCVLCMGHDRGWSEAATSFTGRLVGLGNSHAALLEGLGESWNEALSPEARWRLVDILVPQGDTPRLGPKLRGV